MPYTKEMPDEKLIHFYLSNNPEALATLTQLYKDRIYYSIFCVIKDKQSSEEIFRRVFSLLINNLIAGQEMENSNFFQLAIRLAEQLCMEHIYKTTRPAMPNSVCAGFNTRHETYSALNKQTAYETHLNLRRLISMLPESQRETVSLNHYGGLSFREIAAKMKCSVTNILDTIKLALINLQKLIDDFSD